TRTRESEGLKGVEGLTPQQKDIYHLIKTRGKATREELKIVFNLQQAEIEHIVATLRHCELVRGNKEGDSIYLVPF
ncbi:hypothetical protein ACFLXC_03460, partial [Chloroflexota bacterium]